MKNKIYALVGPSCTFKSRLGIDIAGKFPCEIISADSRLLYKGMDIGTSKPTVQERNLVSHHMVDMVEPDFSYSVALYKKETENLIQNIFLKSKIPLFVGGTGLYLNSVLLGLNIPEVKPDVSFRRQLKQFTQEDLYKNLSSLDPKATNIIHPNDHFRTIRALEVIYKTNRLFSELKTITEQPFNVTWIGLTYLDRKQHVELIKKRAFSFCASGLIDEVKQLVSKYGELELFKKTIGYFEVLDFINNNGKLEDLIEKITLNTKQLVKRQTTWFKANKKINWVYLDDLNYEQVFERVFNLIEDRSFANTSMVAMS